MMNETKEIDWEYYNLMREQEELFELFNNRLDVLIRDSQFDARNRLGTV